MFGKYDQFDPEHPYRQELYQRYNTGGSDPTSFVGVHLWLSSLALLRFLQRILSTHGTTLYSVALIVSS